MQAMRHVMDHAVPRHGVERKRPPQVGERGVGLNGPCNLVQAFDRAAAAFQQAGITETGRSTEDSGRQRKLIGTKGEYEVTAELNRSTESTTKVEITARKSAVEYDKEMAKDILNRILTTP